MIFGKTHKQQQEHLKFLAENRVRKFALLPRTLTNGQLVWLQWVWVKYPVWQHGGINRYIDSRGSWYAPTKYYLTETNN